MRFLRNWIVDIYALANSDFPELYLVDASKLSSLRKQFFLLPLEKRVESVSFWFYGCSLSEYPATFISRCKIERSDTDVAPVTAFLSEVRKISGIETLPDYTLYLLHRGPLLASAMISAMSRFTDFMFHLDAMKPDGFNTLITFAKDFKGEHVALYEEWLARSPIFNESVLKLCPFLRKFSYEDGEKAFFLFTSLASKKFGAWD